MVGVELPVFHELHLQIAFRDSLGMAGREAPLLIWTDPAMLPVKGVYLMGAFSGYGIMASCAAGELLAAHLTGSPLPSYAPAFTLDRYQDPEYRKLLEKWGDTGQL